ncbi:MAG: hypothetical protein WCK65_14935 [Rhodospirillaceae bacterium]
MTPTLAPPAMADPPILGVIAESADLARSLLDVLLREAEALGAMKLKAPTGFAEVKTRLIAAYAFKLEELREVPMVPAAESALAELRVLNDRVMDAARHNAAALEGAIEANKRLLEIVVKAVGEQSAPPTVGYGRIGNRSAVLRQGGPGVSMMITRKL